MDRIEAEIAWRRKRELQAELRAAASPEERRYISALHHYAEDLEACGHTPSEASKKELIAAGLDRFRAVDDNLTPKPAPEP